MATNRMHAMTLSAPGRPLVMSDLPTPQLLPREVLVKVSACGICRTDLHIMDGDLPLRHPGTVLGHEIVGQVVSIGRDVRMLHIGERVGIPWLGGTCGICTYCSSHQENLCDAPVFTGYDRDGGFAQYTAADERYCFHIPARYDDIHAAPLLCAGLIGYRAYRLSNAAQVRRIGIYGFGAAAHVLCQIAVAQGKLVYAFVRGGDDRSARFARQLGAFWTGSSDALPPQWLDCALIFAPVGDLVPLALRALRKGGTVVCAGIHMSRIPAFDYELLWGERSIRTVANLTRQDGELFFSELSRHPVTTHVQTYALSEANTAIADLRIGAIDGAAVLIP